MLDTTSASIGIGPKRAVPALSGGVSGQRPALSPIESMRSSLERMALTRPASAAAALERLGHGDFSRLCRILVPTNRTYRLAEHEAAVRQMTCPDVALAVQTARDCRALAALRDAWRREQAGSARAAVLDAIAASGRRAAEAEQAAILAEDKDADTVFDQMLAAARAHTARREEETQRSAGRTGPQALSGPIPVLSGAEPVTGLGKPEEV